MGRESVLWCLWEMEPLMGLEAGKQEGQSSGWGRVGVQPANVSPEGSLQQRMFQLTTVSSSFHGDHFSPPQTPRSEALYISGEPQTHPAAAFGAGSQC